MEQGLAREAPWRRGLAQAGSSRPNCGGRREGLARSLD